MSSRTRIELLSFPKALGVLLTTISSSTIWRWSGRWGSRTSPRSRRGRSRRRSPTSAPGRADSRGPPRSVPRPEVFREGRAGACGRAPPAPLHRYRFDPEGGRRSWTGIGGSAGSCIGIRALGRKNNRRGFFWSERFKSVIVDNGDTLINCLAYIDLNPVRASNTIS